MKIEETARKFIRADLLLVADMVKAGSRVLDVGCGDGILLDYLARTKEVDGRGIELSSEGVNACVSAGLSVIQGDADRDLKDYPDGAFDYVVLSQTLQAMHAPKSVLKHLMRIGRRAIVSFPNFAYWRVRLDLASRGRMPVTEWLPYKWHNTPNIHLFTIQDFMDWAKDEGVEVLAGFVLSEGEVRELQMDDNLYAEEALLFIRKGA